MCVAVYPFIHTMNYYTYYVDREKYVESSAMMTQLYSAKYCIQTNSNTDMNLHLHVMNMDEDDVLFACQIDLLLMVGSMDAFMFNTIPNNLGSHSILHIFRNIELWMSCSRELMLPFLLPGKIQLYIEENSSWIKFSAETI